MLLSALLLAAAVEAAPTPVASPAFSPAMEAARAAATRMASCRRSNFHHALDRGEARARRLDQLPMADHTLAVLRRQGGCEVSSTIRYNVGR